MPLNYEAEQQRFSGAEYLNEQLNTYLAQINTITTNMAALEALRVRVEELIGSYSKDMQKLKDYSSGENLSMVSYTYFMAKNSYKFQAILLKNTIKAINSSREFRNPMFAERLLEVVSFDDIIEVTVDSTLGKESPIHVGILMNEIAGDIREYLLACAMAKGRINNPGALEHPGALTRNNPDVGARVFEEKYYGVDEENNRIFRYRRHRKRKFIQVELNYTGKGKKRTASEKRLLADIAAEKNKTEAGGEDITDAYRGKYRKTVLERFKLFTHPAPFWEILENGSVGSGDVIPQVRTNFIANSITEIKKLAGIEYRKAYERMLGTLKEEYAMLDKSLDKALLLLSEIDRFIIQTQQPAIQAVLNFREDLTPLTQKQQFANARFAERLRAAGKIPESEIARIVEETTRELLSGKIGSRGRIGPLRMRTKAMYNEWLFLRK